MNTQELIEEVIAEIRRDIDIDNMSYLRDTLRTLIDNGQDEPLRRYLCADIPELRQRYKTTK